MAWVTKQSLPGFPTEPTAHGWRDDVPIVECPHLQIGFQICRQTKALQVPGNPGRWQSSIYMAKRGYTNGVTTRVRKPPRVHSLLCLNFLLLTTLARCWKKSFDGSSPARRTQKQSTERVAGHIECDDNVKDPFRCLQLFPDGQWDGFSSPGGLSRLRGYLHQQPVKSELLGYPSAERSLFLHFETITLTLGQQKADHISRNCKVNGILVSLLAQSYWGIRGYMWSTATLQEARTDSNLILQSGGIANNRRHEDNDQYKRTLGTAMIFSLSLSLSTLKTIASNLEKLAA